MPVLACNPCPCGEYSTLSRDHTCICSEVKRREYRRKISGPIADRIDITRVLESAPRAQVRLPFEEPENSATVAARVAAARTRQRERYVGSGWRINAHVPGPALRRQWPLDKAAAQRLDSEVYTGTLTRRGATRVHRVAWSVADLRGHERPSPADLDVALRLRRGEPLEVASLRPDADR